MTTINLDDMLTLEEAAAWLKMEPRTLAEKAASGAVPSVRISRKLIRFHPRSIIEARTTPFQHRDPSYQTR